MSTGRILNTPKRPKVRPVPVQLEGLMPRILREQWLDNNLTLVQVQEHIQSEYGFLLTQGQLWHRISKYRMLKNYARHPPGNLDSVGNGHNFEGIDPEGSGSALNTLDQRNDQELLEPSVSNDGDGANLILDEASEQQDLMNIDTSTILGASSLQPDHPQMEPSTGSQINNGGQSTAGTSVSSSLHRKWTSDLLAFLPYSWPTSLPPDSHICFLQRYSIIMTCSQIWDEATYAVIDLLTCLMKQYRARLSVSTQLPIAFKIVEALTQALRLDLGNDSKEDLIRKFWIGSIYELLTSSNIDVPLAPRYSLVLQNLALLALSNGHLRLCQQLSLVMAKLGLPGAHRVAEGLRLLSLEIGTHDTTQRPQKSKGKINVHEMFPTEHDQSKSRRHDDVWSIIKTILLEMHGKLSSASLHKVGEQYAVLWHRAPSFGHFECLERQVALAYLSSQQWQCKKNLEDKCCNLKSLPVRFNLELDSGDAPMLVILVLFWMKSYSMLHSSTLHSSVSLSGTPNRLMWSARRTELIDELLKDKIHTVESFLRIADSPQLDSILVHVLTTSSLDVQQSYCKKNPMTTAEFTKKSRDMIRDILVVTSANETSRSPLVVGDTTCSTPRSSMSSFRSFKQTGTRPMDQLNVRSSSSSYFHQSDLNDSTTPGFLGALRRASQVVNRDSAISSSSASSSVEQAFVIDEDSMNLDSE